jgi:hypothetical protein
MVIIGYAVELEHERHVALMFEDMQSTQHLRLMNSNMAIVFGYSAASGS